MKIHHAIPIYAAFVALTFVAPISAQNAPIDELRLTQKFRRVTLHA
jgi:hypothetical protein